MAGTAERKDERPKDQLRVELRRCLVTGQRLPKHRLLRFVAGPGDSVVPDLDGRLPGRGLWLIPERQILEQACRKNLFSRAARRRLAVPGNLAENLDALCERRALDLIGLACRAGEARSGFEKIQSAVASGRIGLYLLARDAAPDALRKAQAMIAAAPNPVALRAAFDAQAQGAAAGQVPRVHLGLAPGRLADRLLQELDRLAALRGTRPDLDEAHRKPARASQELPRPNDSETGAKGAPEYQEPQ